MNVSDEEKKRLTTLAPVGIDNIKLFMESLYWLSK
jgi:hypothetical protein